MILAMEDNLDELINMRDEGLRCLEIARDDGDELALRKWQTCINRIEEMILRRDKENFT